ncbi:MAG TPA: hypothetical protein VMX55_10745 [candidate division Zixibacteria bacterium]|nr:hypothetical protein [candidate division Zixibacteria bacterium]
MTETEIISEKEKPEKKKSLLAEAWYDAPKLARQALLLTLGVVAATLIDSATFAYFARVLLAIPLTIMLSYIIVAGIVSSILSSLSIKEKRTFFGIIALIFSILATLINAYTMLMIHWDAGYSIPP